ncbi:MAG: hypothetical protein MRJ92_17240 [Nitrospira sp.]|nr:hypothetical protein [Nitrospira sp.]
MSPAKKHAASSLIVITHGSLQHHFKGIWRRWINHELKSFGFISRTTANSRTYGNDAGTGEGRQLDQAMKGWQKMTGEALKGLGVLMSPPDIKKAKSKV